MVSSKQNPQYTQIIKKFPNFAPQKCHYFEVLQYLNMLKKFSKRKS